MMRLIPAIFILIVCSVVPAAAENPARPTEAMVDRLIVVAGFDVTFDTIRRHLKNIPLETLAKGKKLPHGFKEAFQYAVENSFSPSNIRDHVRKVFLTRTSFEEVQVTIDFYTSPFGRRLVELERQAQSGEMPAVIQSKHQEILRIIEVDQPRKEIIEEIIAGLHMVEYGMALANTVAFSMFNGMMASGKIPAHVTIDRLKQVLKKQKPALRKKTSELNLVSAAFTYKPITIAELERYKAFLLSEKVVILYHIHLIGMIEILSSEAGKFGKILFERMGIKRT